MNRLFSLSPPRRPLVASEVENWRGSGRAALYNESLFRSCGALRWLQARFTLFTDVGKSSSVECVCHSEHTAHA